MGTPLAFAKARMHILVSSYLAGPILIALLVLRLGVCICSSSSSSHSNQKLNLQASRKMSTSSLVLVICSKSDDLGRRLRLSSVNSDYYLEQTWASLESKYCFNCDKQSSSYFPCSKRFAVESYFREHDNLVDSNLIEYVARKVNFGSDKAFSSLVELKHHLVVFKDASVFGDTNLELPSFHSNRSIVEVHLDVALNKSSAQNVIQNVIQEFKIEIPLHARYPPLEESGHSTVTFGVPQFLMRCKMQGVSPAQSCCLLAHITSSSGLKLDVVVWSIPASIKAHSGTLSIVTFTSALLSAILIIIASNKRLKQS